MLATTARIFLIIGAVFLVIGGVLYLAGRLNIPMGILPGDFTIQGKGFTCIFPLATSLILSLVLSLVLFLVSHFVSRK